MARAETHKITQNIRKQPAVETEIPMPVAMAM
jgi:hypothetical protein